MRVGWGKGGRPPKLSGEAELELLRAYYGREKFDYIAAKHGVCRTYIYGVLARKKLPKRGGGPRRWPVEIVVSGGAADQTWLT